MKKIISFLTSIVGLIVIQVIISFIGFIALWLLNINLGSCYYIPYLVIILISSIFYIFFRYRYYKHYEKLECYQSKQNEPNSLRETFFNSYLTCYILIITCYFFRVSTDNYFHKEESGLVIITLSLMSIYFIVTAKKYGDKKTDFYYESFRSGYEQSTKDILSKIDTSTNEGKISACKIIHSTNYLTKTEVEKLLNFSNISYEEYKILTKE